MSITTNRSDTGLPNETVAASQAIRKSFRKGLLASIMAALHHSRRLQARRTLRQYRHLIADAQQSTPRDRAGVSVPMKTLENKNLLQGSETALIAAIAAALLVLHFFAAVIVQRAPASGAAITHEETSRSLYD